MIEFNKIYNEDCLEGMKRIPAGSVDMVLCDMPYGTTQLPWDKTLDLAAVFNHYWRVLKPNGLAVLFSSQPFTTDLINASRKEFKYEIIWDKVTKTNFYDAKRRPMKSHENILVFYRKQPTYNPQLYSIGIGGKLRERKNSNMKRTSGNFVGKVSEKSAEEYRHIDNGNRYPGTIITISNWNGALFGNTDNVAKHPTQKPVALCEWLIKSYTNEGDTVLDNCMGSGTTAVACINTGRNFIGFETDKGYWETSQQRIAATKSAPAGVASH